MALLEIILQAPPLLEVIIEDDGPAEVELLTGGVQGPPGAQGPPGSSGSGADPGDLILYLQNGLT